MLHCTLPDGLGVAVVAVIAVVAVVGWVVTCRGGVGGLGDFSAHHASTIKCDTLLKTVCQISVNRKHLTKIFQ